MDITTELIKELRDKTGISVMQCRNALKEANGDMDKALAILKKTSSDIALKKADRETKDGRVSVKTDGKKAVLTSLHCETDFVARNEDFTKLLASLENTAFEKGVETMKQNAKESIDQVIQKTGEKIELGEVSEISGEVLGAYVHSGKSAVVVSLSGGNTELAKDIAMHITAMKPEFLSESEIDQNAKDMMTEIFQKEVSSIDKPEDIKKKMLEGKISTYFKEKTLLSQPFIKDPNQTIFQLLEKNKASIKEVKRTSI